LETRVVLFWVMLRVRFCESESAHHLRGVPPEAAMNGCGRNVRPCIGGFPERWMGDAPVMEPTDVMIQSPPV